MKTGMNLLLWTTEVKDEHDPILDRIKAMGFDSVEVPIFEVADRKPYERLGKRLKELGLGATAVTVMGPRDQPDLARPGDPQGGRGVPGDRCFDRASAFGCEILCGPTHSAIGVFSGDGPTADEFNHGVDTLRKAAEKAEKFGIKIAVEYLNRFENYFLTTAADTAKVRPGRRPSLPQDDVRLVPLAHRGEGPTSGHRLLRGGDDPRPRLGERSGIPGTGQVDWEGYWAGLKASGFDGYATIEAFGRALPALAAATKVWRDLFPDAFGLCQQGLDFIRSNTAR